jgi:hypothetical protein
VNLEKLVKRLRREATANPKKVVVLGVLVMVALYFWAPLVWRWVSKKNTYTITAAANTSSETAKYAITAPNPAGGHSLSTGTPSVKAKSYTWQELAKAMELDPLMFPISLLPSLRDPFAVPKPKPTENQTAEPVKAVPVRVVTPEGLGLMLSGTIVGGGYRVARINGRNYHQGQQIEVLKEGQRYVFTLAEVHHQHCVLCWEGKQFQLKITRPKPSGQIELLGAGEYQH